MPSGSASTCQLSSPVWPTSAPGGAEAEQAFELGVLVAVGGVEVDVQRSLPGGSVRYRAEHEGGRGATEAGLRADLDGAVLVPREHPVVQDGGPEGGERFRVAAVDDEFGEAAGHGTHGGSGAPPAD